MDRLTFRVDKMSEAEIRQRVSELKIDIVVESVSNADVEGARKPLGMDPFTYFVIAFGAHLAASLTHDAIVRGLKAAFKDKNIWEK